MTHNTVTIESRIRDNSLKNTAYQPFHYSLLGIFIIMGIDKIRFISLQQQQPLFFSLNLHRF